MKDKTFKKIWIAVFAVGCMITVALAVYTAIAYSNASIIAFIANEWW